MSPSSNASPRPVWDLSIRLLHLGLLVGVAGAWWTYQTDQMVWHKWLGDAVVGLIVYRVYWGFVGPEAARFAAFLKGPLAVWRYVRGQAPAHAGHNPAGGWAVMILLGLIALQAASGQFAADREGVVEGPFASALTADQAEAAHRVHTIGFNILLALIVLHVTVVLVHLVRGDNLIGPMITGGEVPLSGLQPARGPRWWTPLPGLAAGVLTALVLAGVSAV